MRTLAFLLLIVSTPVMGLEWVVDEPFDTDQNVVLYVNQDCPEDVHSRARDALSRFGRIIPIEVDYGGETSAGPYEDGQYTLDCLSWDEMGDFWDEGAAGVTMYNGFTAEDGITEADIAINMAREHGCTVAHEIGHALGLGHYDTPLMRAHFCRSRYMVEEDMRAISALYQRLIPDCTPIVREETDEVYFPSIAGQWVVMDIVDGGLTLADSGDAQWNWACNLEYTPTRVTTEYWRDGETGMVELNKDHELWRIDLN